MSLQVVEAMASSPNLTLCCNAVSFLKTLSEWLVCRPPITLGSAIKPVALRLPAHSLLAGCGRCRDEGTFCYCDP